MATKTFRLARAVGHVLRRESRLPTALAARLRLKDGEERRISLRNVSRSGFMGMVSGEPIRAGSRIILVLPLAGSVEADVRWSLNRQMGCAVDGRFTGAQMAVLMLLGIRGHLLSGASFRALLALLCVTLFRFA